MVVYDYDRANDGLQRDGGCRITIAGEISILNFQCHHNAHQCASRQTAEMIFDACFAVRNEMIISADDH